jgi:hypothetical protein
MNAYKSRVRTGIEAYRAWGIRGARLEAKIRQRD